MSTSIRLRARLEAGEFSLAVDERLEAVAVALFGPSGSGKTTVLDTIAGFRRPDEGEIAIGGHVLFDSSRGVDVPSRGRRIGYVPQDLAIFPHLSVRRNITYGSGRGSTVALDRILDMLEIGHLIDRRVQGLSGGERQRVALARALASAPDLLLLDEPLAALDLPLRLRIIPYLLRVRDELRIPIIYVSHDEEEVRMVADWVLRLRHGRVVASGTPEAALSAAVPE